MIEYLYDGIRAVAGQDIRVNCYIVDEVEEPITEGCVFVLHDKDGETMIAECEGVFLTDNLMWEFVIPADATLGKEGRYWYCIQHENENLCFTQPFYLM